MESLTVPVRTFEAAEDSPALPVTGICWAATTMVERNAIIITIVRLVFIGIPLLKGLLKLLGAWLYLFIPGLRLQRPASPSPFLHQHEENRNQNQHVNRGCDHSSNH